MKSVLLAGIVVLLALTACTSPPPTTTATPTASSDSGSAADTLTPTATATGSTPTPAVTQPLAGGTNVTEFGAVTEGDVIRFYFLLQDKDGRPTTSDGTVKITITDDLDNALYQSSFGVTKSQYVDYAFRLTGQSIGKAFEWRVPRSEVNKGIASFWGKASLTFTTPDGRELSALNETVDIPTYTDEELVQLSEEEFTNSARELSLQAEDDSVVVKITRAGAYTDYGAFSDVRQMFRVDVDVTAKKTEYFSGSPVVAIDAKQNQYDRSYRSSYEFGELMRGTARKGFLLFEDVPADATIVSVTVGEYVFDLANGRVYTRAQKAEEDYRASAVSVAQSVTKGHFLVTVHSAGFFEDLGFDGGSKFRVDIEYRNVGGESDYFSPTMFLLDQAGNQYETDYGGTLSTFSQVFPGVTKTGYVLFEGVPPTATVLRLVFEQGYDANYKPYVFEYVIDLLTASR